MNQSQVKALLEKIESTDRDFFIIFSGKESSKVDGLYKPESCEILIHNHNFTTENQLIYTAIHEYAHHVHFNSPNPPKSARAHTSAYWAIFHRLLEKAEAKGLYQNLYENDPELSDLTKKIKKDYIARNGEIMKEFGNLLIQAYQLCQNKHLAFEDYIDRVLCIKKVSAKSIMKVFSEDISPEIGFENMKMVASIKDQDVRVKAEKALLSGKSPDAVKEECFVPKEKVRTVELLLKEKKKLEKTIEDLKMKLTVLEVEIIEKETQEGY